MSWVFHNGQFRPRSDVSIDLLDAGFVWGAVVVDNCRTYHGRLFRWADHLARFRADCEACYVPLPWNDVELTSAAEELIRREYQAQDLHVITVASPGVDGQPTLIMMTKPVREAWNRHIHEHGVTLTQAINPFHSSGSVAMTFVSPQVKHRARLAWWVADKANPVPDAIPVFYDMARQTYTETAIANLVAVRDGEIVIPPKELVLDGVSLRVVKEICQKLDIALRHGTIPTLSHTAWDELWLCGTGFGLASVSSVIDVQGRTKDSFDQKIMFEKINREFASLTAH